MRIYLNLFGGVAGDMLVAGLLDAGAPQEGLQALIKALPQEEVQASWAKAARQGIAGTHFQVQIDEGHVHRHLSDVLTMLEDLPLTPRALQWATAAFTVLADAEGKAHGCSAESVHFHEVGAMDAILDISAACLLMDAMKPESIHASAITVGSGVVHCAHGAMPVPAPGTRYLLEGLPTCGFDLEGERATPTGVALLRAWQVDFGNRSAATCGAVGYGLGTRDPEDRANLLRVECETAAVDAEWMVELRSLIDDQSGEVIGHALEQLRQEGAVEAYAMPATTKKGRPAFEVVVQVAGSRQAEFEQRMFRLLGTLGLRVSLMQRSRRPREVREDGAGGLAWKMAAEEHDGALVDLKPEFDRLAEVAEGQGKTPREVLEEGSNS
ncbi:MAG: LarC family nickel insertion protein [Planctomycetota bacterium]